MLNQFIEKMLGLTWVITKTGISAEVRINETMRAIIRHNVRRGDVELRVEHRIVREVAWDSNPYHWSGFYRPSGNVKDDGVFTCWSTDQVTSTQARAIHGLFDKAVSNGTDSALSSMVAAI